jgi:Tfp pilus assembly protein PilO
VTLAGGNYHIIAFSEGMSAATRFLTLHMFDLLPVTVKA